MRGTEFEQRRCTCRYNRRAGAIAPQDEVNVGRADDRIGWPPHPDPVDQRPPMEHRCWRKEKLGRILVIGKQSETAPHLALWGAVVETHVDRDVGIKFDESFEP